MSDKFLTCTTCGIETPFEFPDESSRCLECIERERDQHIVTLVTAAHLRLTQSDEGYKALWAATDDEDALTGSLDMDTAGAAAMVQTMSRMKLRLPTIVDALLIAAGRRDRATAVHLARIEAAVGGERPMM